MAAPEKPRQERLEMLLERRGVNGVPLLGHYAYMRAKTGLPEHAHPGCFEICFLVKGRQTYRVAGEDFRLSSGDVFLTLPGEKHSTGGLPEEKGELYWLVLDGAAPLRSTLSEALAAVGARHFRGSWKMKEQLDLITRLYHQPATALNAYALGNRVDAFLLEVVERAQTAALQSPRARRSLQPVLDYIRVHLDESLPVPQLAEQSGLSMPRFKAWFKAETGVPPAEFVLREKVAEAQRRLATGKQSVTEITFDLGFSSSQYFATVFKRFTGATPSSQLATKARTGSRRS